MSTPTAAIAQQAQPDATAVLRHLNSAITWYRQLMAANESAGEPSDIYYLDNARTLARQVVQLAFQSADAEAQLLSTGKAGESAPNEQQNLSKAAHDAAIRSKETQAKIDLLNGQIARASGKKQQELTSQRDTLQGELDFDKALQEGIQKLAAYATGNARNAGGLEKQIGDLKTLVPDLFAKAPAKGATPATSAPLANPASGSGLISETVSLFSSFGDLREINRLVDGAGGVMDMANRVHDPLRTRIRATIAQEQQIAGQSGSQNAAAADQDRRNIAALTEQFQQISRVAIPLSQEIALLGEIQANLRQWEMSVHRQYIHLLESVILHGSVLLLGIILVLGVSEIWRKATFRYVREARRRHQMLLLRRLVTLLLLAFVLILGFVSEFGSLATFAGFLTAGIAVALQTIILSIAAYFFMLGRHGIRVGDRISVSGVTGDVIDVGLVRMSLMELGGSGSDVHPTGRVVLVSNSVLFSGAMFKQIPGASYAWHELVVTLQNGSDYAMAESKMLEAVNSIYSEYRDSLVQQQQVLEDLAAISSSVPSPQASLQLGAKGLDLIVRYPVVLHRETEIDNQVAKKVVEVIEGSRRSAHHQTGIQGRLTRRTIPPREISAGRRWSDARSSAMLPIRLGVAQVAEPSRGPARTRLSSRPPIAAWPWLRPTPVQFCTCLPAHRSSLPSDTAPSLPRTTLVHPSHRADERLCESVHASPSESGFLFAPVTGVVAL
jgi:small-conductance mechanosensitive channel